MLNKLYGFFNAISVTAWIIVVYVIKEKWTFDTRVHPFFVAFVLVMITVGAGALSLLCAKFLDTDNLEKCIEVEQADASFLTPYIGYFLVAFSIQNMYQLFVATIFITIFLFLVRWQYFNVTYLFFGFHCYHVTTDENTKIFVISRKEIRTSNNLNFDGLYRISNTTFIERKK